MKGGYKMVIQVKNLKQEIKFGAGDLLVFDSGKTALVVNNYDGIDFRAVLLDESKVTPYYNIASNLLSDLITREGYRSVVKVIPNSNLKLMEL